MISIVARKDETKKQTHLSGNDNSFFCFLILEWEDKPPVEVPFTSKRSVEFTAERYFHFANVHPSFAHHG